MNYIALLTTNATSNPFTDIVTPIIGLLDLIITPALLLIGAIGAIFCIFLGIKLAKADEPQERDKAKGALKNAVIGFVLIFVLIVALRVGLPAMSGWLSRVAPTVSSGAV
jgi:succinate dehydrogenase/fumarate reductase cytochrome b subunit